MYIGIDLGTSAVKLLLMDNAGKIIKIVTRSYPVSYPHPGWSEQNPEDWLCETVLGIKELTEGCDKTKIMGIGAGGQMHGLVALDKDDCVIRPAILWNDGRTIDETEFINTTLGREMLSKLTANIAFAGFTAPKLLWMKKHEPEFFSRIDKIMLPKDYINYMLSGVHSSDYSDASGMLLLDVEHKCWSSEMLKFCGVSEVWMPRLFESYDKIGTLKPVMATMLGLSPNVIIAAGAGDNAAAAVGTGTVGDGQCNISIGTSGTIFISSEKFGVDPNNALHSFAHADGHFHLMGVELSAASCNKWWMEDILSASSYDVEQKMITRDMMGKNHIFFLPYLMGERSPHNDSTARGAFIGLTMDSSRADMTQAVLEGVAFGIRDSLEVAKKLGLNLNKSKICGGGAKSVLWKEILANVLNLELQSVKTEEGPGYGGAILAAVACGEYSSVKDACDKLIEVTSSVKPNSEIVSRYNSRYEVYRALYPALKPIYKRL